MARIEPIPPAAMPVVEILRRDVPRPKRKPKPVKYPGDEGSALRWRVRGKVSPCCPMGLHGKSADETPGVSDGFAGGEAPPMAVSEFGAWWDRQTSPAAMNKVWPKRGRKP